MKGTSKVIMGATLVMLVSLAFVLGLVLVLLIELYCSLLLRRRRLKSTTPNAAATTNTSSLPTQNQEATASPLSSFYAQGVLDAPRSFVFPAVVSKESKVEEMKNQSFLLHHNIIDIHTQSPNTTPHCLGIIPPSSPQPIQETTSSHAGCDDIPGKDKALGAGIIVAGEQQFMYISNPIYDDNAWKLSREDTPFETPDTSPSRLESGYSTSGEGEIAQPSSVSVPCSPESVPNTPPLTPMKKLPAEACSVSLRDARSLGTSGSDSVSDNGRSSSSSGSPRTSPSW